MKLIWKLLRQNINKPQLIGFFIANFVGLTIVLLALQFYFDVNPFFVGKDKLFKDDYITITKEIGLMNTLQSQSLGFSQEEINQLQEQKFVQDVGEFVSSQFSVFAGINNQNLGVGFNTEMFFESLPDKFIDIQPSDWIFSIGDNTIPIILPKNYLDLYNFGFTEANGMPKITEGLIGLISMDINIYGNNGKRKQMKGRIVGFSDRINTILVPSSFMTWANKEYGKQEVQNPARLMVEVNNIADPNLSTYFKSKDYVISGENTAASKMAFFLKIIVLVVASVGLIICILSFFILALTIYLLLEKNMSKLHNLRLLGYSKRLVSKPYIRLVFLLNFAVLILSTGLIYLVRVFYMNAIGALLPIENTISSYLVTVGIGFVLFLLLSIANVAIIRNKIR